ncbi:MAG: hypothetical protein Q8876_10310 [Bacillota bacterium]|nr:hypothetical protein [Bacillota bacterium]
MKKPFRTVTVTGLNLVPDNAQEQISFSGEEDKPRERLEKVEQAVDDICRRYGKTAISLGTHIAGDLGNEVDATLIKRNN